MDQKLNPELSLALSLTDAERKKSPLLDSGFEAETGLWKLILFYNGSLEEIKKDVDFEYVPLLGNFAVLFIKSADLPRFVTYPQVLYVELSRPLYPDAITGIDSSCFPSGTPTFSENIISPNSEFSPASPSLSGRGTAIAVLDSGVDYTHPDFRNADGTTRILAYWDQTLPFRTKNSRNSAKTENSSPDPNFPENFYLENPYRLGAVFSENALNFLLENKLSDFDYYLSPSDDFSGHGTHVAGICAGSGRASDGRNRGGAPESSLIVVKLKNEVDSVYTDYGSLMMAADFAVKLAAEKNILLAVNISYGSNDGSHTGTSLPELFLNQTILYGKNCVIAATGNEGLTRRHTSLQLFPGEVRNIGFSVAPGEKSLYLELWQSFADTFEYILRTPSGTQSFSFPNIPGIYSQNDSVNSNILHLIVSDPTPYQPARQYFLSITPDTGQSPDIPETKQIPDPVPAAEQSPGSSFTTRFSITPGTWQLGVRAKSIKDGSIRLWLPGREATSSATGFTAPSSTMTFTIPSTASGVISVSGYDSSTDTFAAFSGSGFRTELAAKPDLCAPAVDILGTAPGGGYSIRSGTSMAAPFVSAAAALLMQYGIVDGNDPFLYGEKIKAFLWRGARPLPAFSKYPNVYVGWGALCVRESLKI